MRWHLALVLPPSVRRFIEKRIDNVNYHRSRTRLLLWSSLCFIGLAVNNALLVVDVVLLPALDLSLVRAALSAGSVLALALGLVWDAD